MTAKAGPVLPSMELQHQVTCFLNHEAALLDDRKLREWLALFTDDIRYWMPIRSIRTRRDRAHELTTATELATFDEDMASLDRRVRKLETGRAWAEEPPSRTRHFVSNIRLTTTVDGCLAKSNFLIYQGRSETDEFWFVGERHDRLRLDVTAPFGLRIADRQIFLDQTTLLAPSISIFF